VVYSVSALIAGYCNLLNGFFKDGINRDGSDALAAGADSALTMKEETILPPWPQERH
jgi:hypothetical protein